MFLCTFEKGIYQWLFERNNINIVLEFSRDAFCLKAFQQWTKVGVWKPITCMQMMAWDNFLAQIYPGFTRENRSNWLICFFILYFNQTKREKK